MSWRKIWQTCYIFFCLVCMSETPKLKPNRVTALNLASVKCIYIHVVLSVFIVCNPQYLVHVRMLILGLIVGRVGQCSCLQQMSYEDIHYFLWMISFCQLMERVWLPGVTPEWRDRDHLLTRRVLGKCLCMTDGGVSLRRMYAWRWGKTEDGRRRRLMRIREAMDL